jgi:UDPglucose 6-dehydrogenase
MDQKKTRVCIIGIWHQGAVAAACLADLGYQVVGVDHDKENIHNFNVGKAPLFEPGLDELLSKRVKSGNLSFTTSLAEGLSDTHNILVMFDTPVDENDDIDLSVIFSTAREMAPYILPGSVILVTAQVPVGTCDRIAEIIQQANPKSDFGIAYCPENLRLGQAIERFMHPQLPVIGADHAETLDSVEKLLSVLPVPWTRVNLRTAEMTKHALNAFCAISICFANELGNLCDVVGADGMQIAKVLRLEPRVGPKAMLFPGLGFSGGTLARDMRTLQNLGDRFEVETYMIDGAWQSNQRQNQLVVRNLQKVFGSLVNLKVGVLGLTYKPDTSTLRRSAAIEIIGELVSQGAHVMAYDPKADREELKGHSEFVTCLDAYSTVDGSDALVLITPWPEFKDLDYQRIYTMMKRPVIFDTQNILNGDSLSAMGFSYFGIGRGITLIQDEVTK